MKLVDANVFLRAMTGDDPAKAARCRSYFGQLARLGEQATTTETILAELAYNLVSPRQYGLNHQDAVDLVMPYLEIRGLQIPDRAIMVRAFELFRRLPELDIEDAIAAARAESAGLDGILSYDRDFDLVPSIKRYEP